MASADMSNQAPNITGSFVKDSGCVVDNRIGGMPGPLPDSQQRHWIPDERDAFISWLRGEFAAANAIIDTLCHHLQMVGKPGEYDFVLTCIQQRRYNWTVVLHMQQYFSVAEVVFALQQVLWMKQALNSDPSGLPLPFGSSENGGGGPWKEGPHVYRDPRGESFMPGAVGLHYNSAQEELFSGNDLLEPPRKYEEQSDRRRSETGDQERQQTIVPSLDTADTVVYTNRDQADLREQGASSSGTRTESSSPETSSASVVGSPPGTSVEKEERESDQGSLEQPDSEEISFIKVDRPEGNSLEKAFLFSSKEEEDRRQANVKVTKTYSCAEQVDGKMMNIVDGLELHERVLDKSESNRLAALIHEIRAAGKRGELAGSTFVGVKKGTKGKGRESLHFGSSHPHLLEDHKKRSLPKDDFVQPMPPFLDVIIERLVRWHIIPPAKRPDCCSINIMEEGDYVPPHVDNSYLERPYCTLTLQADCTLILGQALTMDGPGDFKGSLQIALPVGSVLVMQSNSADVARLSIAASPSKRIFITLGKCISSKSSKGTPPPAGNLQSPPVSGSMLHTSWNASFINNQHRQGNNNSAHNASGRGPERFGSSFKSHKFNQVTSGVLPVPTARPPPQIIPNSPTSVPPLFASTTGPPGSAFPPPAMAIPPSWSPLPRPPPSNRPPSAGTGVFFPCSGAASGPGRPVSMSGQRRAGSLSPAPPLLQKTNSAPASFASLEAAASAVSAASAPSTPPSKSATKPSTGGSDKIQATRASPSSPQASKAPSLDSMDEGPQSDANGTKNGKEDTTARNAGRSKVAGGNRTSLVSIG